MRRRAPRPNANANGRSAPPETTGLPNRGQGISNDAAVSAANPAGGVGLDRDLTQNGLRPHLERERSLTAGAETQRRADADSGQDDDHAARGETGGTDGRPAQGKHSEESRGRKRQLRGRPASGGIETGRFPGQNAGIVDDGRVHSGSDEKSTVGRATVAPETVALFEPGARAGGYFGERDWLDRAILGTTGLLGKIVSNTLTTDEVEQLTASMGDDPITDRLRRLASDRAPVLVEGDSSVGHLNNALQIAALMPAADPMLQHIVDRIALALQAIQAEAR